MSKAKIKWDEMESEWRAGIKPVLQLSKEYGVSRAAILKHWEREGVERDLSAKIAAKAEALVTQALVTHEVTQRRAVTEKVTIETNAQMIADKTINQREDVQRARTLVNKLFDEVSAECDNKEDFAKLGELTATPDENGRDRLNDAYRAAISLPERIKSAKALADALKVLIELERKVLRISDAPEQVNSTVTLKADATLPPSDAYKHMLGMA